MTDEAGYAIDHAIQVSKKERADLKKVRSQVDNYTSIAGAKKATRDMLIKELEVAKKEFTEGAKEELKLESIGDENKDKIREDTAKQLIHFVKEDRLPTPKPGNQTEENELAI